MITSVLERTAYVCGESVKLRAEIDNQGQDNVRLTVKLMQVSHKYSRIALRIGEPKIVMITQRNCIYVFIFLSEIETILMARHIL